jgi:hypothetical protein
MTQTHYIDKLDDIVPFSQIPAVFLCIFGDISLSLNPFPVAATASN